MWELDHEEGWMTDNCCFQIVVLEKTLESPLDCKEIQPGNPRGNQLWIFIGRTDAEAETLILWPPDAKNWLIGKDLDAGKDWGQEEKVTKVDKMVGWHRLLNEYEFEQTTGDSEGQGSLECWSPLGHKELDMTWWVNINNKPYLSLRSRFINQTVKSAFLLTFLKVISKLNIFRIESLKISSFQNCPTQWMSLPAT